MIDEEGHLGYLVAFVVEFYVVSDLVGDLDYYLLQLLSHLLDGDICHER